MGQVVKVTSEDELDKYFEGIMIPVQDIGGKYQVPGWKCRHCGWSIGTVGLPPSHRCPDDGIEQQKRWQERITPD